jgi:ABC-2 type transport system permease protein
MIRKELRQTFRDRRMVAILMVAPIFQLTLLGYAVDLEVDRIPTAICDRDRTAESRRLVQGLLADGTLVLAHHCTDPGRPLLEGTAYAVVVIPRGIERDLIEGDAARVQVLVDGTDPLRAQVAESTAAQYFFRQGLEVAQARLERASALAGRALSTPRIGLEPRLFYNPQMESPIYMVSGVAALVLLVVTTIVTAMGIARERELGTIEQIIITPMRPSVLLMGKIIPFGIVGLVVAGLVLAIGTHLFSVPVRGPLLVLFAGTLLYLLTTLGAGVFVSTIARTQQQAILGGMFFIMPAILLSGFATPIENMPEWLQPVTYINPVRYYVTILRANLLKAAGFADLWPQLLALAAFGVAILSLAASRFRRQLD